MMELVLNAQNVTKRYSKHRSSKSRMALDSFSLQISAGSSFALIGPNGAGKTTFLKCCLGLVTPSQGPISLFGRPVSDPDSRQKVCYLPEKFTFHEFYTVEKTLEFFQNLRSSKSPPSISIEEILAKVGLSELGKERLSGLSKGQKQRVGLGTLLTGDADFFILDEPFSGIDPIGIVELKKVLLDLKKEGKTLLISSHILSEIEKICDHYALINKGRCLEILSLDDLKFRGESLENYFYQKITSQ